MIDPLGSNETYTAPFVEIINFNSVTVQCKANVPGTLYYDFSSDGLIVDRTIQLSNGITGTMGIHALIPVTKYGRVRVVNGAVAQTTVNLELIYSDESRIALPTSRAIQVVNDYTDVLNTRHLNDVFLDEVDSKNMDRSTKQKFGINHAISTSVEDIWNGGGLYTGFLTAASAVRIRAGGNTNDTAAGTHARSIVIEGLDENWEPASEEVATAGASASSATTTTFIRINRAYIKDVGTYGSLGAASILIETTAASALVAQIDDEAGQTEMCIYTVPLGFKAFVRSISASVDGTKPATICFLKREDADIVVAPFRGQRMWYLIANLSGHGGRTFQSYPGPFPSKTDIWGAAMTSTGTSAISTTFDIVLVRE